uniref:solute carrier family 49 member A3-like isoform X2 n=1 Tax=Styela clava TaxID=7725 RepID=UPI00193A341D|nr:solute carrier family 49 member A3-like isoform X2 [Styela clava]
MQNIKCDMEYRVYSTRWVFMPITSISVFSVVFMEYCYAGVNDVLTAYFQTTPFFIDLLATWTFFMTAVILVVLALFKDNFDLRNQILSTITCTIIGSILVSIGFSNREWFYIVLGGQTFFGVSSAINFIIQIVLPANWFSVHESATVVGVFWASWSLGQAAAAGILPFVISSSDTIEQGSTFLKVKWAFLIVNGGIALLHIITGIFSWFYLASHPSSPPSASQHHILKLNTDQKPPISDFLIANIKLILKAHCNREYLILTVDHCLAMSVVVLTKILVTSVFLDTFSNITDDDVAWIRLIGLLTSVPASIAFGKLLDKWKKFKELTLTVTMVLGMFSSVTLTEFMIEATYPMDKIILTASHYFATEMGIFTLTSVTRYSLQNYGVLAAVNIVLVTCAISVLLLIAARPHYTRLNTDMHELVCREKVRDETRILLQK